MTLIRSYPQILAFEKEHPAYCCLLVTALLKDRFFDGVDFRKDGPVCFRQSKTYAAANNGEDLAGLFVESRAAAGWLQWVDKTEGRDKIYGLPVQVLVDWESGVFRRTSEGSNIPFVYGCIDDVEHGLFDRKERDGRILLQMHSDGHARDQKNSESEASCDLLADLKTAETSLANESETTRKTLIEARLGQGAFRESLMMVWAGKCAVTKCATKALLRASHIKPWRDSNNQERLDRFNGLLLNPVLDAAFDRGLISFSDAGEILFRKEFSVPERELLGLHPKLKLVCVYEENKPYLAQHRKLHGFPA